MEKNKPQSDSLSDLRKPAKQKLKSKVVPLRQSEAIYRALIETTNTGFVIIDQQGRVIEANSEYVRLTGHRNLNEIRGRSVIEWTADYEKEKNANAVSQCFEKGKVRNLEIDYVDADGKITPIEINATVVEIGGGRQILTLCRDISERKRMEDELRKAHDELEARIEERTEDLNDSVSLLQDEIEKREEIEESLRASEEKYRTLVENANSIILRRKISGEITFFNEFAQKFFGYAEDEILGKHVVGTIVPEISSYGNNQAEMIKEISLHPDDHPANENENVCRDGRRVWVAWTIKAIRDEKGRPVEILAVGNDVTYRKQAEAKLRSLTTELLLTEERERRKIAEALHDSIGPLLSFSEREIGMLEKSASEKVTQSLERVRGYINDTVKQTRSLTFDLSPSSLYHFGLEAAVEELAGQISQEQKIKIHFRNSDEHKPLDTGAKILLYRSIRELLINVLKHSKAGTVWISLARTGDNIEITIKDDGTGFDVSSLDVQSKSEGFGLFSVRERLTQIGGSINIESRKDKGTKVMLTAPLELKKNDGGN